MEPARVLFNFDLWNYKMTNSLKKTIKLPCFCKEMNKKCSFFAARKFFVLMLLLIHFSEKLIADRNLDSYKIKIAITVDVGKQSIKA